MHHSLTTPSGRSIFPFDRRSRKYRKWLISFVFSSRLWKCSPPLKYQHLFHWCLPSDLRPVDIPVRSASRQFLINEAAWFCIINCRNCLSWNGRKAFLKTEWPSSVQRGAFLIISVLLAVSKGSHVFVSQASSCPTCWRAHQGKYGFCCHDK